MAKKDYAAMADGVIKAVGGEGNIANVTHCMTRLRLQLVDDSKLNEEEAKKVPGVMNLIVQNGEYQFVIGQDVPSLYEEMVKHDGIKAGGSVDDIEAARLWMPFSPLSAVRFHPVFRYWLPEVLPVPC